MNEPTPLDLLDGFPRGRADGAGKPTLPQGRFAGYREIREKLAYDHNKLFLGITGSGVGVDVDEETDAEIRYATGSADDFVGHRDDRHVFTVAGSRAGKGRAVLVPNLLLWPHSVVAIDPKGELASETAVHRRDCHHQPVVVLDPFRVSDVPDELRGGFNPFDMIGRNSDGEIDDDNLIEVSMLIADALVVTEKGNRDPHWNESAKGFLQGLVAHVATSPDCAGRRNLGTVRDLTSEVRGGGGRCDLEIAMTVPTARGFVRRAAADFFEKPDNERGSVLSTLKRNLIFLELPAIRRCLEKSSFSLSRLRTGALTVYLCLPARHMTTCGRWFRLLVNLTIQSMETTPKEEGMRGPVLMALDEMATLGHMQTLLDAAGQMAGFGLTMWSFWQDLAQAKEIYGDRWETFVANAGVTQCFANTDPTTAEWISRRLGRVAIRVGDPHQQGASQNAQQPFAEQRRTETTDLLAPHEVALLFAREDPLVRQLLFVSGMPPVVCQKAYHDKFVGEMRGDPDQPPGASA